MFAFELTSNLSLNCQAVSQKDIHLFSSGKGSTICPLFHLALQEPPLQLTHCHYEKGGRWRGGPSIETTGTLQEKSCINTV